MTTVSRAELPLFVRFNQVAQDDELFAEMAADGFTELPADDVFIVAHRMLRDTPYDPRSYYELTYVMEGHAVGYESYSHFNRIFKRVYGITPAAYRAFAAREVAR